MVQELDPSIWEIAKSEKVSPYFRSFVNIAKYSSENRYFLKTRFHDFFCGVLEKRIEKQLVEEELSIVGVGGIGKSSSAVYYVLSCIKNGDRHIHYIDLDVIKEENEIQMSKLKDFAKQLESSDILILDHVTLFNRSTVTKIQSLMPVSKIMFIETGFAASATKRKFAFPYDSSLELSREEFKQIWTESLRKQEYTMKNAEVFADSLFNTCQEDGYILTPRLIQRVRNFIVLDGDEYDDELKVGKNIDYFVMRYRTSLANDITLFRDNLDIKLETENTSQEKRRCIEFSLYTKIILNQIRQNGDFILTRDQYAYFKIAVNVFHFQFEVVNENDLKNDIRFLELALEEGDTYVHVSLLMPSLGELWRDVFFFSIQDILEFKDSLHYDCSFLQQICFQCGVLRKDIRAELVSLQYRLKCLILPPSSDKSSCSVSTSKKCVLKQCNTVCVKQLEDLNYITPSLADLEEVHMTKVKQHYKDHDTSLAKLAVLLNSEIESQKLKRSILINPSVMNLKGIDYIVFTNNDTVKGDEYIMTPRNKRRKISSSAVYLVQVATGSTHNGITIGEALNIFKNIIKNVPVHMMIIVAKKETDSYILSGNMSFENVSVVNLSHYGLKGMLGESRLLTSLVELIRR